MIKFLHNPTDKPVITSKYGMRKHPVTGEKAMHNGIDIAPKKQGRAGDPLYAVADGEVIVAKVNNGGITTGYGYYCVIQHDGFSTLYAHQKDLKVRVGQRVKTGEVIGNMGNSGRSTNVHLHFGVTDENYNNLKWMNPENYLLKGGFPMELDKAIEIIQQKTGISKESIDFLLSYKHYESLIIKLAMAMGGK